MGPYPIIRLGQAQPISQPLQTSQPSILTNPQGAVYSKVAAAEDYITEKLKDQTIHNMIVGGAYGLIIGLILYPIGQSLFGYTSVKKSELAPPMPTSPPRDYAY